jgi:DNA anti-recombination protein RmuC
VTTPTAQRSGTALLTDVKSAVAAIESGDWMSAAGGIAQTALDVIGISADPLGAISSAGFGWAVSHVSFLREPFDMLFGNPESIKSNAASWTSAGSQLTTTAQQYRDTSVTETSAWTGTAANGYRAVSATHANGIEGFAQASQGLSAAITGAGQLVAEIRKVVLDLISQAVNKIIMQIIQALASSWCTFGASVAAAVVQIVQTAVSTAQKLLGNLMKLLQSLQKVFQLVVKLVQIFKSVKAMIEQLGNQAKGESTKA